MVGQKSERVLAAQAANDSRRRSNCRNACNEKFSSGQRRGIRGKRLKSKLSSKSARAAAPSRVGEWRILEYAPRARSRRGRHGSGQPPTRGSWEFLRASRPQRCHKGSIAMHHIRADLGGAMRIRFGYELVYTCSQPVPMILMLHAHPSRSAGFDAPRPHGDASPQVPLDLYAGRVRQYLHAARRAGRRDSADGRRP